MTDSYTKFDLNRHTARLLFSEPFFAALSRRIDKRANRSIPTAGVRVNPESGYFELSYNPEFFAKLTDKEMTGVLKHEFYHLIFEHVTGKRIVDATGDNKVTKRWNIATDLAINSNLIGELPEGALIPEEGMFEEFQAGLSAEQYYALLKDKEEEEKKTVRAVSLVRARVKRVKVMVMERVMVMETVLMITLVGVTLTTLLTRLQNND